MKRALATLALFLVITTPVLAEESTRSGIAQIRDEKKKEIFGHFSAQLNLLNSQITKAMENVLERLQALLNKIKARVPQVDIVSAQAKIDAAKTAVEEQKGKEYIIQFTNESGLRVGASTAKNQLRSDIKVAREKVMAARQAVVDVLKTAKSL